jgi:metacaspase-1
MASVGYSLHIGLNMINPNHYAGTEGRLRGSESDALAFQAIAKSMGFVDKILLTENATREKVLHLISDASSKLVAGDFFFISFSGHGGLLPNLNNDPEPVGYDQTWCLFNAQIVDDELKSLWTLFRSGIRIVVVTDSCYSGTILKFHIESEKNSKLLSPVVLKETYLRNQAFYDEILKRPNVPDEQINSSILLLASCQDDQQSLDGPYNSVFTKCLLDVWHNGAFNGSYQSFIYEISRCTPKSQIPQLKRLGIPDENFLNNKPFKI